MTPEQLNRAACRDEDPELMFPTPGDPIGIEDARDICRRCPIVADCLRSVMREEGTAARQNRHGIRAGRTPGQRRALYERLKAQGRTP